MGMRERYTDAVCREMKLRRDYIDEPFSTIYLGGGTPSQLDAGSIEKLFSYIYKVFNVCPDAEITMECNPDDVTPELAGLLGRMPVNRISMGAQTFSDGRLKFLHRRHNASDVGRAVSLLRKAGIANISIDLMFGFPEETPAEWHNDIETALRLGVEHISAYSLMYEEGTALWKMLTQGSVKEADEEVSLAMYEDLVASLTSSGYEHYEISNFARPGFRSRHNSSYWQQVPYIGLGAAAHSFDIKSRQWNTSDLQRYISSIENGIIPMERETLDSDTTFNDIITTALRTAEGISLSMTEARLGKRYKETLLACAEKHIGRGLLEISQGNLKLTEKGIFVSDMIMSDLMIV